MDGVGYKTRTDDGVIGTSGTPIDVFGYEITSGGAPATVDFHDGTTASGTKVISAVGTTGKTTTVNFGGVGVRFASGCYVNVDANTNRVSVRYRQVN